MGLAVGLQFYEKQTPTQIFFCKFSKIFLILFLENITGRRLLGLAILQGKLNTEQKMKLYIKDLLSKCDQIRSFFYRFGHIYWRNP